MIYFVINNSPLYQGGVEQVVAQIVSNLPSGYKRKITIIGNAKDKPKYFFYSGVKVVNLRNIKFGLGERLFRLDRLFYSYKVYQYLKTILQEGDIVNIHGLEYSTFLRIFRFLIKKKFKLIVTIHGSYFDTYSTYVVKLLPNKYFLVKIFFYFFRWYFYLIEKIGLDNVDEYIFITQYLRKYFKKTYKLSKKSAVIHNGLVMRSRPIVKRNQHKTFNLLLIGSSFYGKGLDIALTAIKKLNQQKIAVNLNLIGFNSYKQDDFRSIQNVNYIGVVSYKKMVYYYAQNDILLLPSRNEGMPLVVFEAIRYNMPFIVSKNCHLNEISGWRNYGIIVPTYQVKDWVEAIVKMKKNYPMYIKKIKEFDFKKYDWKNITQQYINCFQQSK